MDRANVARKADYGIDAGYLIPAAGIVCIVIVAIAMALRMRAQLVAGSAALCLLGTALHTSLRGKFLVWEELLDGLHLRGDELVLDLGCGRGAVLLSAAKRLARGRGVGVDIWSRSDQSGNSVDAIRRNAEAENVSERVVPLTANMMALPFVADTFDVILSNVAIHNIKGKGGRAAAIDEAVRVLRPGGRLLVADLSYTRAYSARLEELGMAEIGRKSLGWRMWWGGPWKATYLVMARKPGGGKQPAAQPAHAPVGAATTVVDGRTVPPRGTAGDAQAVGLFARGLSNA